MRLIVLLAGTSLLAACGGTSGGIGSAGSSAPVGGGGAGGGGTGGAGSGHTFENPTEVRTYQAVGAFHKFDYQTTVNHLTGDTISGQQNQLYAGDANTVRSGGISVTYNPRDAIFDLSISVPNANTSADIRFQDPAHRTDFGGAVEPQTSTPQLSAGGIQYLEVASGTNSFADGSFFPAGGLGFVFALPTAAEQTQTSSYDLTTFFYQQPGTTTRYVTYAGYLRNSISASRVDRLATSTEPAVSQTTNNYELTRGAFVFGETSRNDDVPTGGTGTYSGEMLATAVFNDQIDTIGGGDAPTYFQWIQGTANVNVDFGANTFSLDLDGTTFDPITDVGSSGTFTIQGGATFGARGSGRVDLVAAGGFLGQFQEAWFMNPGGPRLDLLIAGSSIDGAFYGPSADEVGGSYRIVGGTPDERIDILGVFTGQ